MIVFERRRVKVGGLFMYFRIGCVTILLSFLSVIVFVWKRVSTFGLVVCLTRFAGPGYPRDLREINVCRNV